MRAGYAVRRVLWMVPMLFGITLLTFVILDLGPVERARVEAARDLETADAMQREEAVRRLRVRYGMVDADGTEVSTWRRYVRWLSHAARFDFAGAGESAARFRGRFASALTVTALIGGLSIGIGVLLGVMFGGWLGLARGGLLDRSLSALLLVGFALPEFLTASMLILVFGGGLSEPLLPTVGLRDPESAGWSWGMRIADLARHLVLPVTVLSVAPFAIVFRHVRESVVRASMHDFVVAMRNLGTSERVIRRRVLRHGMVPVATLSGTLLPAVVAGSVVVEQAFSLPGIGRLAFQGVLEKDVGVVMAVTLLVSVATLIALLLSDLAHRLVDPRVELR